MNNMLLDSVGPWWGIFPSDSFDDPFKEIENGLNTFHYDDFLKPSYSVKDTGDTYTIIVDYNDKRDIFHASVDDKHRTIKFSIYGDFDKGNGIWSCNYYGQYTLTLPENCNIETMEQKVDKENKKMIITFKKKEKGTADETATNEELIATYDKLAQEYETLKKENEILKKKLNEIKESLNF